MDLPTDEATAVAEITNSGPTSTSPVLSKHDDDKRIAAVSGVKGNICTDARTYVSFLCAWQGFKQP